MGYCGLTKFLHIRRFLIWSPIELFALCLVLFPLAGQAAGGAAKGLERAALATPEDFLEIAGLEGKVIGKKDLLNNFCVAVPSNEGRCTQCHSGPGI